MGPVARIRTQLTRFPLQILCWCAYCVDLVLCVVSSISECWLPLVSSLYSSSELAVLNVLLAICVLTCSRSSLSVPLIGDLVLYMLAQTKMLVLHRGRVLTVSTGMRSFFWLALGQVGIFGSASFFICFFAKSSVEIFLLTSIVLSLLKIKERQANTHSKALLFCLFFNQGRNKIELGFCMG